MLERKERSDFSLHAFCSSPNQLCSGGAGLVKELQPAAIAHPAARTSRYRATAIPFDDFDTDAAGALNPLESARSFALESPFARMSTKK